MAVSARNMQGAAIGIRCIIRGSHVGYFNVGAINIGNNFHGPAQTFGLVAHQHNVAHIGGRIAKYQRSAAGLSRVVHKF